LPIIEPASRAQMSEAYLNQVVTPFNECKVTRSKKQTKKPMRVLSLFGGIGADIACLKAEGIAMDRVIHVEYDKVAQMVYKLNHDYKFTTELGLNSEDMRDIEGAQEIHNIADDGIDHIYDYETFEDLEADFEGFMVDHGRKYNLFAVFFVNLELVPNTFVLDQKLLILWLQDLLVRITARPTQIARAPMERQGNI
jgi:hypothetical protein